MKTRLSILCLLLCLGVFAQKVDLDRFHFKVQYRNFPSKPLSKEYNTYNILFGGSPTSKSYILEEELENSISITGWKKLPKSGHIAVKTVLGDFIITSSTVVERKEDIKDKDGKVTGTKFYYTAKLVYNFPISFTVVDYKGAMLTNETVSSNDKVWTTQEYSTYKEAADYYNNNRSSIKGSIARKDLTQALADITNRVNYKFGYPATSNFAKLWVLNNKKHPEFEATQAKWEIFKAIAERASFEKVSEEDKKALLSVIAYFDELKTKYNTSDKGDKKMRYSSFYNNAMIYTWLLDNFDAAIKEADGLIANDYDTGDGKS